MTTILVLANPATRAMAEIRMIADSKFQNMSLLVKPPALGVPAKAGYSPCKRVQ